MIIKRWYTKCVGNCLKVFHVTIIGLEKMHSQNIMHRNINPANIYMDNEDIVKANLSIAEFDRSKKFE
jgi:serine/threonine protein kinase